MKVVRSTQFCLWTSYRPMHRELVVAKLAQGISEGSATISPLTRSARWRSALHHFCRAWQHLLCGSNLPLPILTTLRQLALRQNSVKDLRCARSFIGSNRISSSSELLLDGRLLRSSAPVSDIRRSATFAAEENAGPPWWRSSEQPHRKNSNQ